MPLLTFSQLLKNSWQTFRARWRTLVIAFFLLMIFALPTGLIAAYVENEKIDQVAAEFGLQGDVVAKYYSIHKNTPPMMPEAFPREVAEAFMAKNLTPDDLKAAFAARQFMGIAPLGAILAMTAVLSLWVGVAIWIICLPEHATLKAALRRSFRLLPKMVGVSLSIIALSFLWLPFTLMLVPGVPWVFGLMAVPLVIVWWAILAPRTLTIMMLALTKDASVIETVRLGLAASRGYWWHITRYMLLLGLILAAVFMAFVAVAVILGLVLAAQAGASVIIGIVGGIIGGLAYVLFIFIAQSVATIFYVNLGINILENPQF